MVIGAPIAIGIALFISHYAPRRLAGILGYLVDLLAAVPSVVFGLWGIFVIRPFLLPLEQWLNAHLGWIPIFAGPPTSTGSTILTGAVVLAVMILPIISSISREIFLQTPRLHEEAALALGATKWETIRLAVFPYARSGVVSAILLGLGRALGETMAIALIISPSLMFWVTILTDSQNSQTIAAQPRAQLPRVERAAARGAHRHRPHAVRHLAGRELRRPRHHHAHRPRRQAPQARGGSAGRHARSRATRPATRPSNPSLRSRPSRPPHAPEGMARSDRHRRDQPLEPRSPQGNSLT